MTTTYARCETCDREMIPQRQWNAADNATCEQWLRDGYRKARGSKCAACYQVAWRKTRSTGEQRTCQTCPELIPRNTNAKYCQPCRERAIAERNARAMAKRKAKRVAARSTEREALVAAVVAARTVEGKSFREIANAFDLSIATVWRIVNPGREVEHEAPVELTGGRWVLCPKTRVQKWETA